MRQLRAFIFLATLATVAQADPVTAFFITSIGVSAATAAALTAGLISAVASFTLGTVAKALIGRKAVASGVQTMTALVRSTNAPREIVYGEVRKSGVLIHEATSGAKNEYLWYVIAVAGHQVEDITDVWIGTEKILTANINSGTGAVTQAPFTGNLDIWRLMGTDAQTTNSTWDAAFADVTTSHRGRGIAMLIVRMKRDSDAYPAGGPPNIFCTVKGKRVYDPRLDSTNGGSGSHRLNDATTWAYSDNPILCAADCITGGSIVFDVSTPNNRLGMGSSRVNWDRVISQANKCDEMVAIPGPSTQKRYTLGVALSCGDAHEANLDLILGACNGNRVFTAGKYQLYVGAYEVPTETISDADLNDAGYKVIGASSQNDLFNQVSGIYFDPARGYQRLPSYVRTDSSFETEDGKPILRNVDLFGVTNEYQAQRIAEIIKQQSRNQIQVELNLKLSALRVAPWDTFYLQLRELAAGDSSWNAKVFRASAIEIDLQQHNVRISAVEESATPYADLTSGEYSVAGSASAARQLEVPDEAVSLSATSIPVGIAFTVGYPSYIDSDTVVELYEYTASTPFSSATLIGEYYANRFTISKNDTTTRYYWVKLKNKRTKQASAEYPTAAAGVAGVGGRVATENMEDNASTIIYTGTYTGPVNVYSSTGSPPTQVLSVAVPAQSVASTMVVTLTGSIDHDATVGVQASTFALITDFTTSSSIASTEATIARNPNTADPYARGRFALEKSYSVAASTAKTFYLYSSGIHVSAPGAVCNIANVEMKVEVVKR